MSFGTSTSAWDKLIKLLYKAGVLCVFMCAASGVHGVLCPLTMNARSMGMLASPQSLKASKKRPYMAKADAGAIRNKATPKPMGVRS